MVSGCNYYNHCKRVIDSLKLEGIWDTKGDRCYCKKCYTDKQIVFSRGNPGRDYVLPIGWTRFGMITPPNFAAQNVFEKWNVAYHGVRGKETALAILISGQLLIPGDVLPDGTTLEVRPGHIRDESYVFTSPSITYSSFGAYASWEPFEDDLFKFVFQVRQMPDSFEIQKETIGGSVQDPHVDNAVIEWKTKRRSVICITGLCLLAKKPSEVTLHKDIRLAGAVDPTLLSDRSSLRPEEESKVEDYRDALEGLPSTRPPFFFEDFSDLESYMEFSGRPPSLIEDFSDPQSFYEFWDSDSMAEILGEILGEEPQRKKIDQDETKKAPEVPVHTGSSGGGGGDDGGDAGGGRDHEAEKHEFINSPGGRAFILRKLQFLSDAERNDLDVDSHFDHRDSVGKWCQAQVLRKRNDRLFLHYHGWPDEYDVWISLKDHKNFCAPFCSLSTPISGHTNPFQVGEYIYAKPPKTDRWQPAQILKIDELHIQVKFPRPNGAPARVWLFCEDIDEVGPWIHPP